MGVLRDLAPSVAALPGATVVRIERSWRGFASVPRQTATYQLTMAGDGFAGDARFLAEGRSIPGPREVVRSIAVPAHEMRTFLQRLADVAAVERPYVPAINHTDDYPAIRIAAELAVGRMVFRSESQGPSNVPWGVEHAGRVFVVESSAVSEALKALDPFLQPEILRGLVRELEAEQRERVRLTPLPTPSR